MSQINDFKFENKFACFIAPALIKAGADEQIGVYQIALSKIGFSNLETIFFDDLNEFFEFIFQLPKNSLFYLDDLKHKGQILVSFLMRELKFNPALNKEKTFRKNNELKKKEFNLLCADNSEWYVLNIRPSDKQSIQFRDSKKLLPFNFEEIRSSFEFDEELKPEKIDFEKHNFFEPVSEFEKTEIWKRVNILKLALNEFEKKRELKLTIGQSCLSEFKRGFNAADHHLYGNMFPNLFKIETPDGWKIKNAGEFILKTYSSGWCYLNPKYQGEILSYGSSIDCNSLYPFCMSMKSGFKYPTGKPKFWSGPEIPVEASEGIYFVHIRAAFKIKDGHFPCIKTNTDVLKNRYKWLENSSVFFNDAWHDYFFDKKGNCHRILTDLYLTNVDFGIFAKHYDIEQLKIIEGIYFPKNQCFDWLFEHYIAPYYAAKKHATGARRQIAKLFLVNLSGKFAASRTIGSRFPVLDSETGIIEYELNDNLVERSNPGYIAVGSLITAYGRKIVTDVAHENAKTFIYADTDSFHGLQSGTFKGIKFGRELGEWKVETNWPRGFFYRQKSYVLQTPNEIKLVCSGMNDNLKEMFIHGIKQDLKPEQVRQLHKINREFYNSKPDLSSLSQGLKLFGNKTIRAVKGGAIYEDSNFEILF